MPRTSFFADIAGGFQEALAQERALTREREARQQQIEQNILSQLIQADDPEIAAAAATSLLESAQPRAKAKGLRGFLDETQRSPVFEPILQLLRQGRQVSGVRPGAVTEREVPTTVEDAPPQAGLPGPLPPGAAAQPAQALTEGGQPGPVTMLPGIAGPIAVPGLAEPPPRSVNVIGGDVQAVPTFRTGTTAQAPPPQFVGQPPPQFDIADIGVPPPPTTTERRMEFEPFTETVPRRIFDPAARQGAITSARTQAEVQGLMESLTQAGIDAGLTEEEAIQNAFTGVQARMGAFRGLGGGAGSQAAPQIQRVTETLPDGTRVDKFAIFNRQTSQLLDAQTGRPFENPVEPLLSTPSAGVDFTRAAQARGYTSFLDVPDELKPVVAQEAEDIAGGFAGRTTGARQAAIAAGPVFKSNLTGQLRREFDKEREAGREMQRQFSLMQTGLERFKAGDENGGSQMILVTFQRILDPPSVVRESEYDRSSLGLGLFQRMEGHKQRLIAGGAGVPLNELEEMVETARQALVGLQNHSDGVRLRTLRTAAEFGLDPEQIFALEPQAGIAPPSGDIVGTDEVRRVR